MIGVAFLTLLERKVLSYIHIRKGPNKVGFVGIFQPFRDAIMLFSREQYFPLVSNYLIYYFSPVFGYFLSLLVWALIPYLSGFIYFEWAILKAEIATGATYLNTNKSGVCAHHAPVCFVQFSQ
jgi:NADH-ubiquinone oxidoreductase chain 1